MTKVNDMSRSLVALNEDTTLIAVVELSAKAWLVGAIVPGVERRPVKKLDPDAPALLSLLLRWRSEAERCGRKIERIVLAFEAGRDGFWLARWLLAQGIEVHVIHSASVAVSREHKRAKTDRLDLAMLLRVVLGWLRGERDHCGMVAIPTLEEEDARRPGRERKILVGERARLSNRITSALVRFGIRGFKPMLKKAAERLATLRTPEGASLPPNTLDELRRDMDRIDLIRKQIKVIEETRATKVMNDPQAAPHAMVLLLSRVIGIAIETADLLVREVFTRRFRDRRAVARFAGLTGSPDESGERRREKGLAKAGNGRVRCGMIELSWRFLNFQAGSELAHWYRERTAGANVATRKTLIVALARKLLIALWRLATTGEVPKGFVLRPA